MTISHKEQQEFWEKEHTTPFVLHQMDSRDASSGVEKLFSYLKDNAISRARGLEMGCGKGRNVIWLSQQEGVREMYGFDFSEAAITEAKKRAEEAHVQGKTFFSVADATKTWLYKNDFFDFVIDCFASTDIESKEGRKVAIREFLRVLKPGGIFMVYTLSPDDEYHKEMIAKHPAEEKNAFYQPTGKFEKTFDNEELATLYKDFTILEKGRIDKTTEFFGKKYLCHHHWLILKK